jgi:hypothetical protein
MATRRGRMPPPSPKNNMTMGTFAKGKKLEGDSTRKDDALFPEEKVVRSIYGGSAAPPSMSPGVSSNLQDKQSTS